MKYSLDGINGNAYSIMGYVVKAMENEGYDESEINAYIANAKSSSYDHLMCVSNEMLDLINGEYDDSDDNLFYDM